MKIKGKITKLEMPSLKESTEYVTLKIRIDRDKDEKLFQKCVKKFRDNEEFDIEI